MSQYNAFFKNQDKSAKRQRIKNKNHGVKQAKSETQNIDKEAKQPCGKNDVKAIRFAS